jgi:hypothetical protein
MAWCSVTAQGQLYFLPLLKLDFDIVHSQKLPDFIARLMVTILYVYKQKKCEKLQTSWAEFNPQTLALSNK